ncbi:MAG TPA: nucleotidyltransferase domain-containing protein [Herpetosiphonaceae bacterium]
MTTPATEQKRLDLQRFIAAVVVPAPAIQGVVAIGSVASGLARPDSDLDLVVFLDPLDWYVLPAEAIWQPRANTFHSIFSTDPAVADGIPLDIARCDLAAWAAPGYPWPEGRRAELAAGWLAFDRSGRVAELLATHTRYPEALRQARLDEAITWLDQHLGDDGPAVRWQSLPPLVAHDRLQAAYDYLVQALFATNRRWRAWRNRELAAVLALPWLPADGAARVAAVAVATGHDQASYERRVAGLRDLMDEVLAHLQAEGVYGDDPIGEAFIRSHEEPGRAWNMAAWNDQRQQRSA